MWDGLSISSSCSKRMGEQKQLPMPFKSSLTGQVEFMYLDLPMRAEKDRVGARHQPLHRYAAIIGQGTAGYQSYAYQ